MFLVLSMALANPVQGALSEGDCPAARSAAQDWLDESPQDPAGWRALGDAELCAGREGAALDAYRWSLHIRHEPELQSLVELLQARQPPQVEGASTGRLSLRQVPEGSAIRLVGEGEPRALQVARGEGEWDGDFGLYVVSSLDLGELPAGPLRIELDHPLLGETELELFVQAGQLTVWPLLWKELPGAPGLARERAVYLARRRDPGPGGWVAMTGAGVAAAGFTAGGVYLVRLPALFEQRSQALTDQGRAENRNDDRGLAEAQLDLENARGGLGFYSLRAGIGAGVGLAGTGVAALGLRRFRADRAELEWDPWS